MMREDLLEIPHTDDPVIKPVQSPLEGVIGFKEFETSYILFARSDPQ